MEVLRGLPEKRREETYKLLKDNYHILPVNENVALEYSKLYYELKTKGILIEDLDLIIAATAKAYNEKLITKDKDFLRLKGLVDVEIIP